MKSKKYSKFIYLSILIILFLFMPEVKSEINIQNITTNILIFFTTLVFHFFIQKDENWFRLDVLFLLGFGIVHFQWAIMLALSNMSLENLNFIKYGFISLKYMNYGTWLATIGIVSWFLGYESLAKKNKKIVLYKIKYKKLLWTSIILFILFIITAGSDFFNGGVYKGSGGSSAGAGISVYFQLLLGISILTLTTISILDTKNKYKNKINFIKWLYKIDKKYLLLTIIYILLFLSIGDRGTGMQIAFTFLIIFGSSIQPIKFKQFSMIIVIGAVILTLIGLGRSVKSDENILLAGASKVKFESNYDVTMELANSVRTLYLSLEKVPEYHNYFFGKLWIGEALSIIPLSQNIYLQLSDYPVYELGSARYITYLRFGIKPPSGEGTSLIADIYLNFSLIGVIIFMFFLGVFMKKLQNELNKQENFYWIITAGIFASMTLYMGRGDLFGNIRPIVWGLILTIILVKYKKKVYS